MSKDEHSYFGPARLDKVFWDGEDVGVICRGTGAFGTHYPEYHPYGQARQGAYSTTKPEVEKLKGLGADEGLVRFSTLHLAELAVAFEESLEVVYFARSDNLKADQRVVLSGYSEAVRDLRRLLDDIKAGATNFKELQERWDRKKGTLEHDPGNTWERYIDQAFHENDRSSLVCHLEACLKFQAEQKKRGRGCPDNNQMFRVVSGLDRHLSIKTNDPRRRLLAQIVFKLFPRLPIFLGAQRGSSEDEHIEAIRDQLRSGIYEYRRRHHTSGDEELEALEVEWKACRDRFFA
ncbi:MAG: hypothetical protein IH857_08765 [Deltaproteobacteria bacterium]|nr:hypothetical protein [Deltaproteobacteria bacterium]